MKSEETKGKLSRCEARHYYIIEPKLPWHDPIANHRGSADLVFFSQGKAAMFLAASRRIYSSLPNKVERGKSSDPMRENQPNPGPKSCAFSKLVTGGVTGCAMRQGTLPGLTVSLSIVSVVFSHLCEKSFPLSECSGPADDLFFFLRSRDHRSRGP
jgi:hypothetical protein